MRRAAAGWIRIVIAATLLVCAPSLARADSILGSGVLQILGVGAARLEIDAPPDVPIQTKFSLPTRLVNGDAALFGGQTLFVQGDLTGPDICLTLTLSQREREKNGVGRRGFWY